ncbi:MAG TPA: hypothetical protein PLA03_11705 [Acidobacteriota bacterium]|nr:hypothetical protein [Acidobacteriota bacterium]
METTKCQLCGIQCNTSLVESGNPNKKEVNCPSCGVYRLMGFTALAKPADDIYPNLYYLSAVCRSQWDTTKIPYEISGELLRDSERFHREILSRVPSDIIGKTKAIIWAIAKRSQYPGQYVNISVKTDYVLGFSKNVQEFRYYLKYLDQSKLVQQDKESFQENGKIPLCITPDGWARIAGELKNEKSNQCFVAMWFDKTMDEIFLKGIKPLEDPQETGYSMVRVDMTQYNGKICDRIVMEIKSSRFMIVDVTGHRQAVYYEAGYAMGLGLPVIWCCRNKDIKKCKNFDTRQYNHILWETPEDLKDQLKARILATIGKPL